MKPNSADDGYLITLGAAFCGGAAGGTLIPWLWADTPVLEIAEFIWANVAGMAIGTLPGWAFGLCVRLVIEKCEFRWSRTILPAISAYMVGFLVAGGVMVGAARLLGAALGGI